LTPHAWRLGLVTAGLLGAAVNTGNNLIYLMFSLLAAAFPVSAVLGALNLRRVRGELKLPTAPRVGSPFAVDVEICVDRAWPAARSVELTLLTDQEDLGPCVVERMRPGERARVTLTGRGKRRGPMQITGLRVRSTFPFGFLRHKIRFDRADELLVLPSASRSRAREGRPSLDAGGRALSARVAGTETTGLRRGRAEDDARKVDWKVTARRGVTIIRETAGESRRETRLDVTTRCGGEPDEARRRFEQHVSRAAGRAQQALEAGGTVHLRVDAAAAQTHAGRGALLQLLRRLARLEPTGEDGTPLPPMRVEPQSDRPDERRPDARASAPGRALRASSVLALTLGAAALYVADGIGPVPLVALIGSLIVTTGLGRFVTRARSVGSRIWKAGAVVALVAYFLDILLLRRDLLGSSLMLTVFITLFVIFNARGVDDDRRLLHVSFLHVVLAAALTTEVAIALPLVGWLLAVIHGLMAGTAIPAGRGASTQRAVAAVDGSRLRYAAPCLAAGAAVLATCLLVFAVVPHFGTGAFRPGMFQRQSLTGFSDTTSLGDIGRIKLDHSKVMEVELSGARPANADLRWRGLALNEFDGRTWTRSYSRYSRHRADDGGRFFPDGGRLNAAPGGRPGRANLLTHEIRLEPGTTRAVFSAAHPRVVVSRDFRRLGEDGFGNLELPAKATRRLKYTVASELPPREAGRLRGAAGNDPRPVRALNLGLPDLDPRIPALAREITANAATRYDAAVAVEQWLSGRLAYSLAVDDRGAADPLARFLFDGMAGHCEYFATAMVVLAREAGIPARFVAGYLRGERGRFGERYVVRQSDAHSWVEIYFPGIGWVPFDPTPAAGRDVTEARGLWALATYLQSSVTRLWDDYLVGIDLDDQVRGLLALTNAVNVMSDRLQGVWRTIAAWHPLRIALLLLSLGLLAYVARRAPRLWRFRERRKRARPRETTLPAFYAAALALLSRSGLSRRPGETPAELAARAESLLTRHGADRLDELTRLYYRVRFDGVTREGKVSRIARALLGDVRAGLRKPQC
jgi:uncharacterized protein (DUF58 family)